MSFPPTKPHATPARATLAAVALASFTMASFTLASFAAPGQAAAQTPAPAASRPPARAASVDPSIVAIVNGEIVSMGDVASRRRLFALTTGQAVTPDVLDRLTPQVIRQLIDEKLRLQEIRRRKIIVSDQEIAQAIAGLEQQNGMPPGTLRARLAAAGVDSRTLIDQIRAQIGWGRVIRDALGPLMNVSESDVKQQEDLLKSQTGQPEYNIAEIFVPITDPAHAEDAQRFADTVITQLHNGASFGVMASQFSQSQTALQGGDRGWVQGIDLDPAELDIIKQMPVGAISNPIRVPGGLSIISLRANREIGKQEGTVLHMRQAMIKFQGKLDPQAPTAQQRAAVEQAKHIAETVHSCEDMEAAAKAAGDPRGGDPGEVRLEAVGVPALRQLMATMPLNKASQPLIAEDGVAVMMICSRETGQAGLPSKKEIVDRILAERFELQSRQLLRDLQRRALIDRRV
jgi:peptidyl-prolyl cis-trans isomerase SurA